MNFSEHLSPRRIKDGVNRRVVLPWLCHFGPTRSAVFTAIYRLNYWNEGKPAETSISGPGSNLDATTRARDALLQVIAEFGVRSLLDAPCGDLFWMRHVPLPG